MFEKIKSDYKIIKKQRQQRKEVLKNYAEIKRLQKELYSNNNILKKNNEEYDKKLKNLISKEKKFSQSLEIENYMFEGFIYRNFKKIFYKNTMIFLLIRKTHRLNVYMKKVQIDKPSPTIFHQGKEYKVVPQHSLNMGGTPCGIWIEDKLEQISPNMIDKAPVTSSNFKKIFEDQLIWSVFSPRDENKKFPWMLLILGAVAVLVILQLTGVIDLTHIYNQLIGHVNPTASNITNTTSAVNPDQIRY